MGIKKIKYYWLFRCKETGVVILSRHSRPDFVSMLKTEEEIKKYYDRVLVIFQEDTFDYE